MFLKLMSIIPELVGLACKFSQTVARCDFFMPLVTATVL